MLVASRHDDQQIDVAVLVGLAVRVGAEQYNLVGLELLCDGMSITSDHAHRHLRAIIGSLGRKRKRTGGDLSHD